MSNLVENKTEKSSGDYFSKTHNLSGKCFVVDVSLIVGCPRVRRDFGRCGDKDGNRFLFALTYFFNKILKVKVESDGQIKTSLDPEKIKQCRFKEPDGIITSDFGFKQYTYLPEKCIPESCFDNLGLAKKSIKRPFVCGNVREYIENYEVIFETDEKFNVKCLHAHLYFPQENYVCFGDLISIDLTKIYLPHDELLISTHNLKASIAQYAIKKLIENGEKYQEEIIYPNGAKPVDILKL